MVGSQLRYTRMRLFTDVIEYIVGKIDSSILFDATGTATDSFYYFKTFESETCMEGASSSNKPFENIGIMQITDAIPLATGVEKADGATTGYLTFSQIMDYLSSLGFYWTLEERTTNTYFVLKHFTEISNSNGSINLDNYKGKDFTKWTQNVRFDDVKFGKIKDENNGGSLGFKNINLDFPNLTNSKNLILSNSTFITDIDDIRKKREAKYNEESTEQFALFCLLKVSSDYYVRDPFNDFSNIYQNNIELSPSFLFQKVLSGYQDSEINIFSEIISNNLTIYNDRIEKRKKVELNIPINKINDVSLLEKIKYKAEWLDVDSTEIDLKNNNAKITLKKL